VIRKLALGIAGLSLVGAVGVGFNPTSAWATAGKKVDCDKVMSEVGAGKKTKDIAADLKISTSSVYRCKKKAAGAAAASKKVAGTGMSSPAAATSPAAAASPAGK
jgi:hypothetical protein